jgi:hypothetical protein
MKNKNTIKTIFVASVILLTFFSFFHPAKAADYTNQEKIPGASQVQSEFIPYLKDIINFGFAIVGILALFMLIIGAYQYLMAAGSGNASGAKETISSALLGLVLGLTAWVILYKINPDLVNMRAITKITGTSTSGTTASKTTTTATTIPTTYSSNASAEIQQKAKEYAAKNGVPEAVAMRMLSAESGGVNGLTSSKGAAGLLQLMPGTAKGLGVTDVMDVDQNLNAGYKYANQMYTKYGDWGLAMAAYNWGPGNLDKYLAGTKSSMPTETINYVNKTVGSCSFCPT